MDIFNSTLKRALKDSQSKLRQIQRERDKWKGDAEHVQNELSQVRRDLQTLREMTCNEEISYGSDTYLVMGRLHCRSCSKSYEETTRFYDMLATWTVTTSPSHLPSVSLILSWKEYAS
ncbi:hypothetical protein GQ44DRAFT_730642 [Phaeosphaeriaceae sp. PMI808]|nr:hypothetical protein GQ44DRAFT_730642 [Phaeosphaeriaceae sp. PMI808]